MDAPARHRNHFRVGKARQTLLNAYKASYEDIPPIVTCACCGLALRKEEGERHHPAGRRRNSFLFYCVLHSRCHHQKVHAAPRWAEERGLLVPGRNSQILTMDRAALCVSLMPFPQAYILDIYRKYQPA